jgi:ATP-binding cassette subfamily B protein
MPNTLAAGLGEERGKHDRVAVSLRAWIARIWQHCRSHKREVAVVLFACLLETAFFWVVPLSFRALVDNALGARDRRRMIVVLLALAGGVIVASTASIKRGKLYAHLQSQILSDIRFQIFHKVQRLPVAYFTATPAAEIVARASGDLAAIEAALTMSVTWGLMPALDAVAGTIVLFVLDWRLALIAVLVWPWCAIVPARLAPGAAGESYERRRRETETLDVLHQAIAGHGVIRAYNLEEHSAREFLVRDGDLFTSGVRLNFLLSLMDQSAMIGMLLLQVLVIGVGAWLAFRGSLTLGTLAAFQGLCLSVSTSLLWASQYSRDVLPARASLRRIDELLAEPDAVADRPGSLPAAPLVDAIEFSNVTLARESRRLLDGIDLRIPRGAFVAIVGMSGAGKSTLVSLLLRFEDPTDGAILVDGVDLRSIRQRSWRAQIGVVFQENYLFDAPVRENIRLGWPSATNEMVEQAARAAEIHDVIACLPLGYDSPMGDRGRRFSGGERQRIALARALVRNPDVLILDEAGAALDPGTDAAIAETLRRLSKQRTVVSVTHRLESIAHADLIVVMDRGRIVESGTNEQLLAMAGMYLQMQRRQRSMADRRGEAQIVG